MVTSIGDDVPFEKRLAEAIAWCEPRADPTNAGGSLRSSRLRPSVLAETRAETVRQVLYIRGWDMREIAPIQSPERLGEGRLLAYWPDEQLADGAAEAETNDFFDVENVPAWDTWVGLFADERSGDYLVSWVPASLVDLVGRGISVNPEECIKWLTDSDVPAASELRSVGLLR